MSTVPSVPPKPAWDPASYLNMEGMIKLLNKCDKHGLKDESEMVTGFPYDLRHSIQLSDGTITAATCIKESHLKAAFGEQHWEAALGWLQLVGRRSEVHFANGDSEKQAVWKRTQLPNKYPGKPLNPVDPAGNMFYSPPTFWNEHADFVPVLFYDPAAGYLDQSYRRFILVPNLYVSKARLTRRLGTVDIKFPHAITHTFHCVQKRFKLCTNLGRVSDFDLASSDACERVGFSYYVCTLEEWFGSYAHHSSDSEYDEDNHSSDSEYDEDTLQRTSRTLNLFCGLTGVKFIGNELMFNTLSSHEAVTDPFDGVPANVVTIAKEEVRAMRLMQSYWKRRAISAEACTKLMCGDAFDCAQARKILVDAHTKEVAAGDGSWYDGDGFWYAPEEVMPWREPAPFSLEVEKTIGSILGAVPGGKDYAKCAEVYGSGPMGNKRKRPDSAPPTL